MNGHVNERGLARRGLAAVSLLALLACGPGAAAPTGSTAAKADGCVERYNAQTDYFPEKMELKHAKGFKIEYFKHYKVVTVTNPWRDAKEQFQYVLVHCGTPAPKGFDRAQVVNVPIKSIMTMSTTHLPHLEALGVQDKLVGHSEFKWVSSPSVVKMIKEGKLTEIGGGPAVNVEQVIAAKVDLVTASGVGDPKYDAHPKLIEAGVKVGINAEYMEETPLGRSEWLKFTAAFFNKEQAANKYFEEVDSKYQAVSTRARAVPTKPAVFTNAPFQGTWYMPGGNSYVARSLADAGAKYLWDDDKSTGSIPLSFEAVFDRAKNADFWLSPGLPKSMSELLAADSRFGEFAAVKNGKVWNNNNKLNENGGNDVFESAVLNPHLYLLDMVKALHPTLAAEHQFVWFRHLK